MRFVKDLRLLVKIKKNMNIWQTFHVSLFGNSYEFRSFLILFSTRNFEKRFDFWGTLAAALAAD